jgi:hypothetical protein
MPYFGSWNCIVVKISISPHQEHENFVITLSEKLRHIEEYLDPLSGFL